VTTVAGDIVEPRGSVFLQPKYNYKAQAVCDKNNDDARPLSKAGLRANIVRFILL